MVCTADPTSPAIQTCHIVLKSVEVVNMHETLISRRRKDATNESEIWNPFRFKN